MKKIGQIAFDIAEITGKTLLSLIPVGGTCCSAIFDAVKNNILQNRLEKWQNVIETKLAS